MSLDTVQSAVAVIKEGNPQMKDSTLSTYTRQIKKLFEEVKKAGGDMTLVNRLPNFLYNVEFTLGFVQNSAWGELLKPTTRKNTMSVILCMMRADPEGKPYKEYRKIYDVMKEEFDKHQELQIPTEVEEGLKDVSMEQLHKGLNHHFNKLRGVENENYNTALLHMLGHLHLDQVLRNEACSMLLTEKYITIEEDPNANFIWLKGRNMKVMVIRNNKVRNPARGDEPKEVYLKGAVNSAINKYVQVLKNVSGGDMWADAMNEETNFRMRLAFHGYPDSPCSSSQYSQLFKKIWEHLGLELTTTQLRKVYAMDVRKKFGGNLVKEKEACAKLDHSKDTHDKHYILDFT